MNQALSSKSPDASFALTATQQLIDESRILNRHNRELRTEVRQGLDRLRELVSRVASTMNVAGNSSASENGCAATRLSGREKAVLRMIADGYETKEIAGRLGISYKTAVTYRTRLMDKLKIHEATGLTRYAIRTGLVRA